jgi:hypothetical protein
VVNHYEALGVSWDAGPTEIRAAYLALARTHHPDFHLADPPDERDRHATRMKAVTEAWDVLGDAGRRARYDERLRDRAGIGRGAAGPVTVPAGKGWTPRADDDGWMTDHAAWAAERDRLLPDDDPVDDRSHPLRLVPPGLFALAVVSGFLGLALNSRPLLAASLAGVIVSSVLFVVLPLVAMTRHVDRGAPSRTARRTPFTGR